MYNNYNKAFKYFNSLSLFNTKKVSTVEDNTAYSIGNSSSVFGTPEILWENICFIEDEKLIWTHGTFYANGNSDITELEEQVSENEQVTSSALIDLQNQIDNISYQVSENEQVTASALIDLQSQTDNISYQVSENEQVTASALIDLQSQIDDISYQVSENEQVTASALIDLQSQVSENEQVTASALIDLQSQVSENEQVTASALIDLQNQIDNLPSGGGGGNINLSNYYTKSEIDSEFASYNTRVTNLETAYSYFTPAYVYTLNRINNFQQAYSYLSNAYSYVLNGLLEDEEIWAAALNDLNGRLDTIENAGYITETDIKDSDAYTYLMTGYTYFTDAYAYVSTALLSAGVQSNWTESDSTLNTYILNKPDLSIYPTYAWWDSTSSSIKFKNGNTILNDLTINGESFIIDGMVDNVSIQDYDSTDAIIHGASYLLIDFNTAAEKNSIKIDLQDIFNSNNYYTKTELDTSLNSYESRIITVETAYSYFTDAYSYTIDRVNDFEQAYTYLSNAYSYLFNAVLDDEEVLSGAISLLNNKVIPLQVAYAYFTDAYTYVSTALLSAGVQSNWNETDSSLNTYILNKPDLTVYPTYAWWDSTTSSIKFKNGNTVLNDLTINGESFIIDTNNYYTKSNIDAEFSSYDARINTLNNAYAYIISYIGSLENLTQSELNTIFGNT